MLDDIINYSILSQSIGDALPFTEGLRNRAVHLATQGVTVDSIGAYLALKL